jgi:hypothetical protein
MKDRTSIRGRILFPNTPIRVEALVTAKNTKSKQQMMRSSNKKERLEELHVCQTVGIHSGWKIPTPATNI